MTPEEARELHAEMEKAFERLVGAEHRFDARRDPKLRPPDAIPVEFVLLGYPILDSPPLPEPDGPGDGADLPPEPGPAGGPPGNVRPRRHNDGAG